MSGVVAQRLCAFLTWLRTRSRHLTQKREETGEGDKRKSYKRREERGREGIEERREQMGGRRGGG